MEENDKEEGLYHISYRHDSTSYFCIPGSRRIFIDGGCVIAYDEDDQVVAAYADGVWAHVVHESWFEGAINLGRNGFE